MRTSSLLSEAVAQERAASARELEDLAAQHKSDVSACAEEDRRALHEVYRLIFCLLLVANIESLSLLWLS
jgi:hypothetical protein